MPSPCPTDGPEPDAGSPAHGIDVPQGVYQTQGVDICRLGHQNIEIVDNAERLGPSNPGNTSRGSSSSTPDFQPKAQRVLDLYQRVWDGKPLGSRDYVISADEQTSIQARCRCHPTLPPG